MYHHNKLPFFFVLFSLSLRLQTLVTLTQRNMQYRLLSVSPSELCLELLPRVAEKSLEPLRVSVTTTASDEFQLQVLCLSKYFP